MNKDNEDWMGPLSIPSDPHFVGESKLELIAFVITLAITLSIIGYGLYKALEYFT